MLASLNQNKIIIIINNQTKTQLININLVAKQAPKNKMQHICIKPEKYTSHIKTSLQRKFKNNFSQFSTNQIHPTSLIYTHGGRLFFRVGWFDLVSVSTTRWAWCLLFCCWFTKLCSHLNLVSPNYIQPDFWKNNIYLELLWINYRNTQDKGA